MLFHKIYQHNHNIFDSVFPNISIYNQYLGIHGDVAEELTAEQIMMLVSAVTGDNDLRWFYTVDINLFKKMAIERFKDLLMPMLNGRKWAIFSINDALLDDEKRLKSSRLNEFNGTHWFTAAVWIE